MGKTEYSIDIRNERNDNHHEYYVDLSMELWSIKQELIKKYRNMEDNRK